MVKQVGLLQEQTAANNAMTSGMGTAFTQFILDNFH
jgi:hypothetical protein